MNFNIKKYQNEYNLFKDLCFRILKIIDIEDIKNEEVKDYIDSKNKYDLDIIWIKYVVFNEIYRFNFLIKINEIMRLSIGNIYKNIICIHLYINGEIIIRTTLNIDFEINLNIKYDYISFNFKDNKIIIKDNKLSNKNTIYNINYEILESNYQDSKLNNLDVVIIGNLLNDNF
uniref:Uncharacterized protein n=1 Tax=Pithovirus LCDPAC02 TaxID=2506601 RepID=A0A481YNZ9_9VIRU|nr:MAG: hypothetical protein LCDPAC02_00290 [Pithovirus LCDPAC02]